MSGPPPGTGTLYDRAEIARIARIAYSLDQSMAEGVAGHFGVSLSYARQLVSRARQAGYDIPSQAGWVGGAYVAPQRELSPHGTPGAYRRHLKAGEKPCEECRADHRRRNDMYRTIGTERMTHDADGVIRPVQNTGVYLLCDCGAGFNSVQRLTEHTVSAHRRGPSTQERTPT